MRPPRVGTESLTPRGGCSLIQGNAPKRCTPDAKSENATLDHTRIGDNCFLKLFESSADRCFLKPSSTIFVCVMPEKANRT